MKNIITLIFAIVLVLGIYSCSDGNSNSSNPPSSKFGSYFPTTIGSYWIYKNIPIDTNGVAHPLSATYDSVVLVGPITLNDTAGFDYKTFTFDSTFKRITDTSVHVYYRFTNEKIYRYSDVSGLNVSGLGMDSSISSIPKYWSTMLDFTASLWRVFKMPIDSTTFKLPLPIPINGSVEMQGEPSADKSFQIGSSNVITKAFLLTLKIDVTITIPGLPVPINTKSNMTYHYYVGNNIGFVSDVTDPSTFNMTIMSQKTGGYNRTLLRYHLK
ncbi:MAG: hypothetical protein NT007_12350 [Candidatus Kapabacteria bacterium]|nr:hypothetical protein [Candidatus Kapabacteria bacterium]